MSSSDNRGLASADEETKERIARKGGSAPHEERGLQAASEETKECVARAGGEASHEGGGGDEGRGFAGMDEEKQREIAKAAKVRVAVEGTSKPLSKFFVFS
jgi:hypothetical protein